MPCFENSGAKLYFEETGCGNPLIFLHGAAWDMHQWDEQIRYFSKEYRVIALDARGHGKSSLPPGKVSPDIFWRDVVAMMDFFEYSKSSHLRSFHGRARCHSDSNLCGGAS